MEGFVGVSVGKVEGLSPSPFVEERGQVVVGVDERFVFLVSLICIVGGVEAVVFVDSTLHISWGGQAFLLSLFVVWWGSRGIVALHGGWCSCLDFSVCIEAQAHVINRDRPRWMRKTGVVRYTTNYVQCTSNVMFSTAMQQCSEFSIQQHATTCNNTQWHSISSQRQRPILMWKWTQMMCNLCKHQESHSSPHLRTELFQQTKWRPDWIGWGQ